MQRSIFVLCLRRVPFFRQALFHKERVSDGLCSQQFFFCASGGFLFHIMFFASGGILFANSSKKYAKNAA